MTADDNFNHETSNPYEGWPEADVPEVVSQDTLAHRLAAAGRLSGPVETFGFDPDEDFEDDQPTKRVRPRYAVPVGVALIGAAALSLFFGATGANFSALPLVSHHSSSNAAAPIKSTSATSTKPSAAKVKQSGGNWSTATPQIIGLDPPAPAAPVDSASAPAEAPVVVPASNEAPVAAPVTNKTPVTSPPVRITNLPSTPAPVVSSPPVTTPVTAAPAPTPTTTAPTPTALGCIPSTSDEAKNKCIGAQTTTTTTQPTKPTPGQFPGDTANRG